MLDWSCEFGISMLCFGAILLIDVREVVGRGRGHGVQYCMREGIKLDAQLYGWLMPPLVPITRLMAVPAAVSDGREASSPSPQEYYLSLAYPYSTNASKQGEI